MPGQGCVRGQQGTEEGLQDPLRVSSLPLWPQGSGRDTGAALGIEGRSQRSFCSVLGTGNHPNLRQHDKGGTRLCCQSGSRNPPTPSSQALPLKKGSPAESWPNRWLDRSEPISQAAGVAEFCRRPGPESSAHWVQVQGTEECSVLLPQTLPELGFDSFTTSLNSSCNHDLDSLKIAGAKSYAACKQQS